MEELGVVILAGGKSSRMQGKNKALLLLEEEPFLMRIISQCSGFKECRLSVANKEMYPLCTLEKIIDKYENCGPIGGLYTAVSTTSCPALLAVSCDIPLLTKDFIAYICSQYEEQWDAVIPLTRNQKIHPLCGIYHKRIGILLEEQIKKQDYKLKNAIAKMKVKYILMENTPFPDWILDNVNTPEEYKALCNGRQTKWEETDCEKNKYNRCSGACDLP